MIVVSASYSIHTKCWSSYRIVWSQVFYCIVKSCWQQKQLPQPSIGLSIQFHAGNYKTSSIKSKCHKNLNLNFSNHNIDLEGHKLTGWHFLSNPRDSKYLRLECFCRSLYFVIRQRITDGHCPCAVLKHAFFIKPNVHFYVLD